MEAVKDIAERHYEELTGPAGGTRSHTHINAKVRWYVAETLTHMRELQQYQDMLDRMQAEDEVEETTRRTMGPRRVSQVVVSATMKAVTADMPTITQAMRSEEEPQWTQSIVAEIQNLVTHGTGVEVSRAEVTPGAQILPVKVVLKKKRDSEGKVTKYKARLCVLGNLKKKSFESVYSPTANEKSLKLLLSLATALKMEVMSLDVYGAFLYPDQKGEVFVMIPPSVTGGAEIIWKLKKTMYGLDSSPRAYYDHVSAHLLKGAYDRCASDPCFFYKKNTTGGLILIVVHVDDFAVAASDLDLCTQFVEYMESVYVVSFTRDVDHFLGMHVTDLEGGSRRLSQPGLLKKIFEKHPDVELLGKYPQVPMSSIFADEVQAQSPGCDKTKYMELLGSLMYVVKTRFDIAYAVSRLAMRTQKATERDYNALLRVLAYLYNTRVRGIVLTPLSIAATVCILFEAWCDASYATHPDGHSHTGYGFRLSGTVSGFFFARSTKQTNVALSSTEAELNAAVECAKDIVWYRALQQELGMEQRDPTVMYVDNASLITLAMQFSGNHKRVKHFLVRVNFLMELVDSKQITLVWISTKENLADGLTKPLGPMEFIPKTDGMSGEVRI